jgi:hypothetical protein
MGSPEEGSGGTPLDTAPRDGRKSTDSHPVPNANEKASGGSTPETEGGKFTTGYERISESKVAGGGDEKSVSDPAGPEGRAGYDRTDSVNFIKTGEPMPSNESIGEVEQ